MTRTIIDTSLSPLHTIQRQPTSLQFSPRSTTRSLSRLANFYFWYFAFIGVFGTYFALYLQSLAFSAATIALLLSLQQIVRVIAPYLWGWLADRMHRRTAIIRVTLSIASGIFPLLFFLADAVSMALLFAVVFFFWSAALPLFEANVIQATGGDSGRYARVRLWGSVGFIAAVLTAGWILDRVDIRLVLWMVQGLLVVTVLSAWVIPEQIPPHPLPGGESVWHILRQPSVMALFAACFLMVAAQSATMVFYSIYMVENGHGKTAVGVLWSIGVLAEIGIFLLLPRLNVRFTPAQMFSFSFGMTAVRFLLVGWFPASFAIQALAQTFHAFTFGTWHAAAMSMLHRLFPGRLATRGQALYTSFSFGVGGALGGVGAGIAWGSIGPAWTFSLMSILALLGWLVSSRGVVEC